MRASRSGVLILIVTLGVAAVFLAAQTPKEVALTGEIVDLSCYVKMGAVGMDHKECAIGCAKAGMPMALLEERTGKLYLLVSDKEFESVNGKLQPFEKTIAQKSIVLKGRVYEKAGQTLLEVLSVGKAK
jgi:hypothetical protein